MIRFTSYSWLYCVIVVTGLSITPKCDEDKCISYEECSQRHEGSRIAVQRCISPDGTVCCPEGLLPFDDCGWKVPPRIISGKETNPGDLPWIALVGFMPKDSTSQEPPMFTCGGTLISRRYVLTAAHCVTNLKGNSSTPNIVRLGECDLRQDPDYSGVGLFRVVADNYIQIEVEAIIPHEYFNNVTYKNDIALLRLTKPVEDFTDYIQPICLPFGLEPIKEDNLPYRVAGWGTIDHTNVVQSDVLRTGNVTGANVLDCNELHHKSVQPIDETQICAEDPDGVEAAKGDSGGPLFNTRLHNSVSKVYQFGIVSFRTINAGPGHSEQAPGVFTNVTAFRTWILKNMKP